MKPLTDAELETLITESQNGRQNAHKRALRTDAIAARDGSETCRQFLTERHANRLRASSMKHSATVDEARKAITAIRLHHKRPQNGSVADAYHLLADIAERVVESGCLLALDHESALEHLPERPERCSKCTWTLGANWGCEACERKRGQSDQGER